MKRVKKLLSAILVCAMMLSLLTACGNDGSSAAGGASGGDTAGQGGGSEDVYELSLSTHDPSTSTKTKYFQQWADRIEEASGGRLNITIYSGGSLAAGTAALDALRTNVCDIAWVYTAYFPGQFPLSEIINQPIGCTCVPQATQVLYALYDKYPELQQEVSEFVPLMMHSNPTNKISSIDGHPITCMDDLKGLTFRASAGVASDSLQVWGATPIQLAPGDIYQAVEKGTVEGYIFDWSGIVSFGLQEVTKYYTTMPVYLGTYYLMMNMDSFNGLPEDLQQILLDNSGLDASMEMSWAFEYDEAAGRKTIEEAGGIFLDVSETDEAEFRAATVALLDTWIDTYQDLLADVDAYVADAKALAEEYTYTAEEIEAGIADLNY